MYSIAFDVGIVNLAYAIASEEGLIVDGMVLNIAADNVSGIATNVVRLFDSIALRYPSHDVRGIYIEKQPTFIAKRPYNQGIYSILI
jgi:hypothetical protein